MEAVIKKLPDGVQTVLQSSSYINSFRKAVEELVYNSLDSHAVSIAVRINHSDFSIQVIDNGSGVIKADMDIIGTKYTTSKVHNVRDIKAESSLYGFRGISLASLIDVSDCLKITSRRNGSDETWAKVYRKGKLENVYETVSRPSHGTTVEVKGLLHNLEIKRRNLNPMKEMQEIKKFIELTAVLHTGVSFSLRDDVKNAVISKIPKNRDIFQTIQSLYGFDISKTIQEFQIEKTPYKVKAFVGKKCMEEEFQLIYLNGRHVDNSKLHKIVNINLSTVFGNGKDGVNKIIKKSQFTEKFEVNKMLNPFYILLISCPYNAYDMSQISNKTLVEFHNWTSIIGILKTLVKVFAEGLEPKTEKKTRTKANEMKLEGMVISNIQKENVVENIHEKVTRIVERTLKSDSRKLRVQNGVNGKPAKRRNKTQVSNILKLNKTRSINEKRRNVNKLALENISTKSAEKEILIKKEENNKCDSPKPNKQNKDAIKQTPVHTNKKQKITYKPTVNFKQKTKVRAKTKSICMPKKQVTKVFEALDGSVKQRCKNLSKNVANLMKKYSVKNVRTKHVTIERTTKMSNVHNEKIESVHKRSGRIVIREFVPFPQNCDRNKFLQKYFYEFLKQHCGNTTEVKTSYDLLQTIIRSQNVEIEGNVQKPKESNNNILKENFTNVKQVELSNSLPTLTYQSHCYEDKYQNNYTKKDNNESIAKINEHTNKPIQAVLRKTRTTTVCHSSDENTVPTKKTKTDNEHACIDLGKKRKLKKPLFIKRNKYHVINSRNRMQDELNVLNMNILEQSTQYDFDEEINTHIPLSLTYEEMAGIDNNLNNFKPQQDLNENNSINSTKDGVRDTEYSKCNYTYVVDKPVVFTKPIVNQNINNECVTSTDYISDTNDNDNTLLFKSVHAPVQQQIFNDSITKVGCTNERYLENCDKITENDVEVIFTSKPYPDNENFDKIIVLDPINVCQAIMESSDLFDSDSLNFQHSNVQKICKPNLDKSVKLKKSNVMWSSYVCESTEDNLPNGQIENENFDSLLEEWPELPLNTIDVNEKPKSFEVNRIMKPHDCDMPVLPVSPVLCMSYDKNLKDKKGKLGNEQVDKAIVQNIANTNVMEGIDGNGKVCFVHVNTGMTFNDNRIENDNNFKVKRRPNYVPKGLSPIFQNERIHNKNAVELPSQDYFAKSMYEEFVKDVEKCTEVYEAGAQNLADATTDKARMRFRKLNASIVFDGAAIGNAKVLNQVDGKFIACVMEGRRHATGPAARYLALFDQHAAHERVRLESLIQDYKLGGTWESKTCDKLEITLSEEEFFYIENFGSKFKEIGLDWIVDSSRKSICVVAVPTAVLGKHNRKLDVVAAAVKRLIREHVKILECTNNATDCPKTLLDLVNMEACRFAVKFGDRLGREACEELIRSLAGCSAPFQCAHGRPDMALLLAVRPDQRAYKINMEKLKKIKF